MGFFCVNFWYFELSLILLSSWQLLSYVPWSYVHVTLKRQPKLSVREMWLPVTCTTTWVFLGWGSNQQPFKVAWMILQIEKFLKNWSKLSAGFFSFLNFWHDQTLLFTNSENVYMVIDFQHLKVNLSLFFLQEKKINYSIFKIIINDKRLYLNNLL